jgi:glyoxylase-like metal-dependent hydrolase (beta-lactamase superfamily II)
MSLDIPTLYPSRRVGRTWTVFPAYLPVPGMGVLAVNSFLLHGREPLLVDTGRGALGEEWMDALAAEIDPADLRWIWISHLDADHVGNLDRVLEAAPRARVVTGFLGAGKMRLAGMDASRVDVLEPGRSLLVDGRELVPMRPPYFDAPETVGFFDPRERVLFAVDSYGALLPGPVEEIGEVADDVLRAGVAAWSAIDAPWLADTDVNALDSTLAAVERLQPAITLSAHLPVFTRPVGALNAKVLDACRSARQRGVDPFAAAAVVDLLDVAADAGGGASARHRVDVAA